MSLFLRFLLLIAFTQQLAGQVIPDPVFQHILPAQLGLKSFGWHDWDSRGLMWGTYKNGLYSYDGYTTHRYNNTTTDSLLLSETVFNAAIDSKDNLWFCYDDASGLTRYHIPSGRFRHFRADSANPAALPTKLITAIKEDSKGTIWVLTWGGGIVKLDQQSGTCRRYLPHAPQTDRRKDYINRVRDMVELPDGRFLVVFFTYEDFDYPPMYFDPATGTFTNFPIRDYISETEDQRNNISFSLRICHFVYRDPQENLWFGTYSGLIFVDTHKKEAYRVSGLRNSVIQNLDNARAYVVDEKERLWIATPNSGVMVVDSKTKDVKYVKHDLKISTSVADDNIRMLKKDRDGNIWVGTGQAISIYNPLVQQFDVLPWADMNLEFTDRSIQRIPVNQFLAGGNGALYITGHNGIHVYDAPKKRPIKAIEPKKQLLPYHNPKNHGGENYIGDIKYMPNGEFLAISSHVVPVIWHEAENRFTVPRNWNDDTVRKFGWLHILFRHVKQERGLYLIGGYNGTIYHYDTEKNLLEKVYRFGIKRNYNQNYSFVLPSGKWLLSFGEREFCIFDPVKKQHKLYGPDHADAFFPDSTIKTAYLDKNGLVWLATANGLYTFDERSGKTTHINRVQHWPDAPVNALIEDKQGVFWIAQDRQLLKWDRKTGQTFTFGNELGLRSGEFISSIAQTDDEGNIYMVNVNGVLVFNPAAIRVPQTIPQLSLSALTIREDSLDPVRLHGFLNGKAELKWNENFLQFEFASSQIYTPLPHQFYYRLAGLDSNWQHNGISNKIRYPNLAPGSYTLDVKIKNAYDLTSPVLRISFSIKPPFWKTWWFYLLVLLLLAFAAYHIMKYRERAFRRKQQILEERIRERTAEVVAKAEEISQQKDIIQEKNKELTDSIHYALRIQQAILPEQAQINTGLPEHFIYFVPKDIVSGDFYWYSKQKDSVLWAVVDCTGHGVPGGFMSMLGAGLLNQIVNEELTLQPDIILNHLRDRVIMALKQTGGYGESKDGMDMTLCRYLPLENKLQFAGAHNPLYIVRHGELLEFTTDKQPIGIHVGEKKPFTLHETMLQTGDVVYMTSDGYADQFGGEKGKKFKSANLEKLFVQLAPTPVSEQKNELQAVFTKWKDGYEQLDDVCVFGVKIV